MSQEWRKKTFYKHRVLIETKHVITPRFNPVLICLAGAELEMLRNMTQYLHRRSTYSEDYDKIGYYAPTNEEWEQIEAIVAELEGKLMSDCLETLIAAITSLTSVQSAMMTCICQLSDWQSALVARLPDLTPYVTDETVTYGLPSDTAHAPIEPGTDEEKCEFAQAVFYSVYQMYTEILLPFAQETSDSLVAMIVAATAFGAVAGFVGIPVAILSVLVYALVGWGVSGSIANFSNWLWDNKDEVICIMYTNLPDMDAASIEMKAYIDDAGDISYLDKALLKTVLASSWHYSWIIADQRDNGTWDASFIEDQCATCIIIPEGCFAIGPCDLGDWDDGTLECVDGGTWLKGGRARWEVETPTCPSTSWLTVMWIPRTPSGTGTARANFSLYRMGAGPFYDIIDTPERAVNVPVIEYGSISAGVWGYGCRFAMQQDGYWCQPIYWCLTDHDPRP